MFRILGLVLSIGLVDGLNPTTLGPSLYLASKHSPVKQLLQFTLGVFAVYFIGGGILLFGPGEAILALLPSPSPTTKYILEVIAGAVLLVAAVYLWVRRCKLGQKGHSAKGGRAKSRNDRNPAVLGATIMIVELPTAFPYFAVIAAIVGSGAGFWGRLFLLIVYNVCFVAPVLVVIGLVAIFGDDATRILSRIRNMIKDNWPQVLAVVALVAGVFVVVLGITGLLQSSKSTFGRFSKHLRRAIT